MMSESLTDIILRIDAWLDTMRCERGYGGPVAHRWQDCLIYTGPGFDWRYEGIVSGYLRLYQVTGELRWLAKARRAGDDLLSAQLPDGRYPTSSFEANPSPGGTPHEAACDLALLRLAACLQELGDPAWKRFLSAARQNLVHYHIQVLWDPVSRSFRNSPSDSTLVPNKIATLAQAGFALAKLEGNDALLEQYFLPGLDCVLAAQIVRRGNHLHGAIDQSIAGRQPSGRYFPYYVARCVPALLSAFQHRKAQVYLDAAVSAMEFVFRCQLPDGSFPQVLYANGRRTVEPRWIAACGDILCCASLLAPYGFSAAGLIRTEDWLFGGILPSGGVRTASGFSELEFLRPRRGLPDFRDLLPACGWVDKAFYYLACQIPAGCQILDSIELEQISLPCLFQGEEGIFSENESCIQVRQPRKGGYRWRKGRAWADL